MQAGFAKYWKSIDVVDDYTFKFTYTEWQNRFLRDFADVDAMPVLLPLSTRTAWTGCAGI